MWAALLAPQSKLLTWSARITPCTFYPEWHWHLEGVPFDLAGYRADECKPCCPVVCFWRNNQS